MLTGHDGVAGIPDQCFTVNRRAHRRAGQRDAHWRIGFEYAAKPRHFEHRKRRILPEQRRTFRNGQPIGGAAAR